MQKIPDFFREMLNSQYGESLANKITDGFCKRVVTLRANTIKSNVESVKETLTNYGIDFKEVIWYKDALIIENAKESDIRKLNIYENGAIYLQSLSSMIPPIILNPKPKENILDMTAAPGGKTTEMCALSENKAMITACEKNKIRADRLRYNLEKQGVKCVNVMVEDARKLDNFFAFDKILLDAPCSGSGTLNFDEEDREGTFTKELVERSVKVQEELLRKAVKILKPGGEIVYSTCSILKNENEDVLNKVLSKEDAYIVPIEKDLLKDIPLLPTTIDGTICVLPTNSYEGFFVAKIKKKYT